MSAGDLNAGRWDALRELLADNSSHRASSPVGRGAARDDEEDCCDVLNGDRAAVTLRFAASALRYLRMAAAAGQPSDDALCAALALTPESVVLRRPAANAFQPAFFVAVDEPRRTVVVSIRGTKQWSDVLTDYMYTAVPFPAVSGHSCGGSGDRLAHDGFLRSALYIAEAVRPLLLELMHRRAGSQGCWKLRIVGHSLGGAVAALLALLLCDDFPAVRAVAFGPPPCMSSALSEASKLRVISFVNGNDVIPRLSSKGLLSLFLGGKTRPAAAAAAATATMESTLQRLVPPGRTFHVAMTSASATCFEVPTSFYSESEAIAIAVAVADHRKTSYLVSFESLVATTKRDKKETSTDTPSHDIMSPSKALSSMSVAEPPTPPAALPSTYPHLSQAPHPPPPPPPPAAAAAAALKP